MANKYTHILLTYPSQDGEILFRASDGMMIGERSKTTVIFGEDRNAPPSDPKRQKSRIFLEGGTIRHNGEDLPWNDNASRFLREFVAAEDLRLNGVTVWVNSNGDEILPGDGYLGPRTQMTPKPALDIRCQEGSVILAPDSLDMRVNGGGMPAVSTRPFNKSLKH